jgi:nitrogen fixation NifU-like protein
MTERFSELLMEHFLDPNNRGTLTDPDGTGVSGVPGQGPYFVIQVKCADGIIKDARFHSHNCGVTVASGSVLTGLILNMPLTTAIQLTAQQIAASLGGVPPDKQHIPETAIMALRQALEEAQS